MELGKGRRFPMSFQEITHPCSFPNHKHSIHYGDWILARKGDGSKIEMLGTRICNLSLSLLIYITLGQVTVFCAQNYLI